MNLNVIQEHKEFFTKEKINEIKKRLHENNEITFYIFFRDREGIDKTIEKDKDFNINTILYNYYYIGRALPINKYGCSSVFKHHTEKDIRNYYLSEKIPTSPLTKVSPPDKYGIRKIYKFVDARIIPYTTKWAKAEIRLSQKCILSLRNKKKNKERIIGFILGIIQGPILILLIQYAWPYVIKLIK